MERQYISAFELANLLREEFEAEVVMWDVADDGTFLGVSVDGCSLTWKDRQRLQGNP